MERKLIFIFRQLVTGHRLVVDSNIHKEFVANRWGFQFEDYRVGDRRYDLVKLPLYFKPFTKSILSLAIHLVT